MRRLALLLVFIGTASGFGASGSWLPGSHLLRSGPRAAACRFEQSVRLSAEGLDDSNVRWVAPIDPSQSESDPSEGSTVMPLFPLGVTYLPYTSPVLNIFEVRARAARRRAAHPQDAERSASSHREPLATARP